MTNQIHTTAVRALNTMKAAGIAQNGRTLLDSFKVAKEVTQRWAKEVRRDVFAEFSGSDNKDRGHFLSIIGCADSLTFKGWADLTHWLAAVEAELVVMISKHSPMTYVKHRASGRVRRFAVGSCDAVNTQTKPVACSEWGVSAMTVGQAMADIDNGSAFLCNEAGEALKLKMTKPAVAEEAPAPVQYTYFTRSVFAQTLRRFDPKLQDRQNTEILADGVWVSSLFTVGEAKAMIAETPSLRCKEDGTGLTDEPIKAEARKLLALIEKRGFGPDMQITQMWDDIDTICGLARSLRLQLISEAGHTGNGMTQKEHLRIRTLIDVVPTRRCFLDTLKAGWNKLHYELSKIVLA